MTQALNAILLVIMICCGIMGAVSYSVYDQIIDKQNERDFLIVYVAGKYWDNTPEGREANTYAAMDAGIEIYFKCHYAIIPHLGHWVDPRMTELGYPQRPNSFWYVLDNMILDQADVLLKISDSRGANAESKLAQSLGIPVVYSVDDIPNNCGDGGFEAFYDGSKIG